MDICLRNKLPLEVVDNIMKKVHRLNFKPCLYAITHNLTWCRLEVIKKTKNNIRIKTYEYTFLIGDYYGYYHQLEVF